MSVYVDDMMANYKGMVMCHMIADTTQELWEMAERIGVKTRWAQCVGDHKEHFDICKTKRRKAIVYGAKPITQRELARMILERKSTMKSHELHTA